jgi:hypothetical protein
MAVLVLAGESSKSIAMALEVASGNINQGRTATTLFLWDFSLLIRTSFAFKKFICSYRENLLELKFIRKRRLIAFFRTIQILKSVKANKQRLFEQVTYRNINITPLVWAQTAALQGTGNVDPIKLSWRTIIDYLVRVISQLDAISGLDLKHYQEFYCFNGRQLEESACISAARSAGLKTYILEKGCNEKKFMIYRSSPHNNLEWWANIEKFISDIDIASEPITSKAKSYLDSKSRGFDPFEKKKWIELMDDRRSDESLSDKIDYVVFFSVSTGEVSPFPDFMPELGFRSQEAAINALIEICGEAGKTLVIRRHPNSLGVNGLDAEEEFWKSLIKNQKHLIYIPPKSRVDSYEICKKASAIFTWRSTIGIDTLHLGIPTFALGPAKWARNKEVQAFSRESIRYAIASPGRPHMQSSLEFAVYITNFGLPYRSFSKVDRWGVWNKQDLFIPFHSFHKLKAALRKIFRTK